MAGKIKKRVPDIPVHKIPMKERIKKDLKRNYLLYLMLLPGIFILICFKVGPVGAMVIAFQDFSAFKGILGSEWVGLKQFIKIFQDPYMLKLIKNTVVLAILSIVVVFPFPIIFSLFLNEVRIKKIPACGTVAQLPSVLHIIGDYGQYSLYSCIPILWPGK